jgi:hypothetical protein
VLKSRTNKKTWQSSPTLEVKATKPGGSVRCKDLLSKKGKSLIDVVPSLSKIRTEQGAPQTAKQASDFATRPCPAGLGVFQSLQGFVLRKEKAEDLLKR